MQDESNRTPNEGEDPNVRLRNDGGDEVEAHIRKTHRADSSDPEVRFLKEDGDDEVEGHIRKTH